VLWQPPVLSGGHISRVISGASRRIGEGNENFIYPFPSDFKRSLTCRKILRHGTFGFTSHPEEDVLRIFAALKSPLPWPGSNPRPLGPGNTAFFRKLIKLEHTHMSANINKVMFA
jgi:hypothetical protein